MNSFFKIIYLFALVWVASVRTLQDFEIPYQNLNRTERFNINILRLSDINLASPPDEPVIVETNLFINRIEKLSTDNMQLTLELSYTQRYTDSRLIYRKDSHSSPLTHLALKDGDLDRIWTPDKEFVGELDSKISSRTAKVFHTGFVKLTERITVSLPCPMDLRIFPFDIQSCRVKIGSRYTVDTESLVWSSHWPVQTSQSKGALEVAEFSFVRFSIKNHTMKSDGEYSYLVLDLAFIRNSGYYLLAFYLPATMMVIVSWLSFFVHVKNPLLKSGISLLSLIALVQIMTTLNKELPHTNHLKVIDVWTGTCLAFIFASLVESVLVHYLDRNKGGAEKQIEQDESFESSDNQSEKVQRPNWSTCKRLNKIDCISIVILPTLFLLFAIGYYLSIVQLAFYSRSRLSLVYPGIEDCLECSSQT